VTAIISRIFENATAAMVSAQELYRLCRLGAGGGSAAPHLTCGAVADKRVSLNGQADIVDANVDDPVQTHRRARNGHEAIGNSFDGGGTAVVLPDSNGIG
jgi:hypothetical protein